MFALFLLTLLLISPSLSGDCANPLLNVFGFIGYSTPTLTSSLNYCKSLQSTLTCCPSAIINNFQNKTDQLTNRLQKMVIRRDKFIVNTQTTFLSDFQNVAVQFSEAAEKAIPILIQADSSVVDLVSDLLAIAKLARDKLTELKANLTTFQESRKTCIIQMAKIQAALWCLACDPFYADKGVSAGPIVTVSSQLCSQIENACYSYIEEGASQSLLLQFRILLTVFERSIENLYKIADKKVYYSLNLEAPDMPLDVSRQPNIMPYNCTNENNCQWACNYLFTSIGINETLLGFGGGPFGTVLSTNNQRLLEQKREDKLNIRILAGAQWNPDADEAGVEVSFDSNPGNVQSSQRIEFKVILAFLSIIFIQVI